MRSPFLQRSHSYAAWRICVVPYRCVLRDGGVPVDCAEQPKDAEEPKTASAHKPAKSKKVSDTERLDALSRARVWQQPHQPISQARLNSAPDQPSAINCTFLITEVGGTAPKFDCQMESGERLRVKYGRSPEIPSEVAAARLLSALGFGADEVTLVEKLRCYGCPAEPFITRRTLGLAGAHDLYGKVMNTGFIQGLRVGRGGAQTLGPRERKRGG